MRALGHGIATRMGGSALGKSTKTPTPRRVAASASASASAFALEQMDSSRCCLRQPTAWTSLNCFLQRDLAFWFSFSSSRFLIYAGTNLSLMCRSSDCLLRYPQKTSSGTHPTLCSDSVVYGPATQITPSRGLQRLSPTMPFIAVRPRASPPGVGRLFVIEQEGGLVVDLETWVAVLVVGPRRVHGKAEALPVGGDAVAAASRGTRRGP
jgi:hypothetical protein